MDLTSGQVTPSQTFSTFIFAFLSRYIDVKQGQQPHTSRGHAAALKNSPSRRLEAASTALMTSEQKKAEASCTNEPRSWPGGCRGWWHRAQQKLLPADSHNHHLFLLGPAAVSLLGCLQGTPSTNQVRGFSQAVPYLQHMMRTQC